MSKPRTVYFTGDGRLGNQLFQAAFLDSVSDAETTIYSTGMEEMLEGFEWTQASVVNRKDSRAHQSAKRWIRRLGRLATKLRLIDGVSQPRQMFAVGREKYKAHGGAVQRTSGLMHSILYVDKGYYQNAELADAASFRLKNTYTEAAQTFLRGLPDGPKAFVHVRRGDYAKWTIFGRSPLLPLDYFQRGMEEIRASAPDVQFILLSDDVETIAATLPGLHVFRGANVYEDFGMMVLCDGGIISNSTLSWWGGFFCRRTLPVISPKGFLAHGLGFEYPVGITAAWMSVIDV